MKNRKLNQLLVAGMISAAMMTSGISVQAADFSDDTSTVEEQSVGSAEEEAPEVEDGSEFQSDAAEASSAVAVSSANFPDAKFRQYVLDNIDTDKDKKLSAAEIKAAKKVLDRSGFHKEAFEQIASIDLKKEEQGILSLSQDWQIPFVTYTEEELKQVPGEFTPSPFVKKITGVDNVCERSAVLASGNGRLLQRKTGENGVTTAVAAREWRIHFE